jgi:uncharacterized protein YbjT (DUF2867 family)
LLARGDPVRVLARDASRARNLLGGTEVRTGDVRDAASLRGIARRVDAVIACVGTRTYFGGNGGQRVDAMGTTNLASEIAREGAPHLVYLSAFGLDRDSVFLDAFSRIFGEYYRWKAEAERAVRSSGVPYTIVRPVELVNRLPRGPARVIQTESLSLLRAVSRDLVADVLVQCAGRQALHARTFELCEDYVPGEGLDAQFAQRYAPVHARRRRTSSAFSACVGAYSIARVRWAAARAWSPARRYSSPSVASQR